jgi:hypothetical protein
MEVAGVSATSATLEAEVNPQGKATRYRFQYGLLPCASNPCTSVPVPEAELPAGSSSVRVKVTVEGLSSASVYYFRVLAKNGESATSADHLFATRSASAPEGLPEGRAYEQVSPLNKDGGDAQGKQVIVKAADGGNAVSFGSTFGMPGGVGAQVLPSFLATRSAGWSTRGLLPPAGFGERAQVLGWLPDYSKTFSNVTRLGNPRTKALLMQSTDGSPPVLLTPYVAEAEYAYAGATAGASVVFFESKAKLPPREGQPPISAALEGASNLYAWDGASGEVHLVGVLNGGTVPGKGTFAGPYDWGVGIKSLATGGAARSYYLQEGRAITAAGNIYFTAAGTGQLYLRKNPTRPQSAMEGETCLKPADACTIHVSVSKKTNGKGQGGGDPAGAQPAAFQAASEDGSKAFFTSPEMLTDDAKTGPEQPESQISLGSIAGSIEKANFIPVKAVGIAVDGSHVYWADPVDGTIGRANLDGSGEDKTFITPSEGECEVEVKNESEEFELKKETIPSIPRYLAVDGEYIYWTNAGLKEEDSTLFHGGSIGRAKLDGEEASIDPDFICGPSNPQGIAVDATHIYWANAAEDGPRRFVSRANLDGSGVDYGFIHLFGQYVPYGVALSADHVYIGINDEVANVGYVMRARKDDGEKDAPLVGLDTAGVRGVSVDASHVYWASQNEEAIGRSDLALESPEKSFISVEGMPAGLAVDASHLYWSVNGEAPTNPGNDLYRYEPATDTLSDLTPDSNPDGAEVQGVVGVAGDGSRVYFVANGDLDGAGPATPGDCHTASPHGAVSSTSGHCDLYIDHEGAVSFIARLHAGGAQSTNDVLNWIPTPRELFGSGGYVGKSAFLSANGRTLLFRSTEQLSEYENEGAPELYRYREGDPGGIRCVSCRPDGGKAGAGPGFEAVRFPLASPRIDVNAVASRVLSADGEHAFFETGEALSPADTNGDGGCPPTTSGPVCLDVYEWTAAGSGECEEGSSGYSPLNGGCVYLISTGKSKYPSFFADASASGKDVFFFTRQQLVGQDEDELQDVYDARVEGGIASQNPQHLTPCESTDGCHGPAQAAPTESSPATPSFQGPGDEAQHHKKPKPKAKKQKKQKKQKQLAHRRSRSGRPAGVSTVVSSGSGAQERAPEARPAAYGSSLGGPGSASAPLALNAGPAWTLTVSPMPSNFFTGVSPDPEYLVIATNVGGASTTGEPTVLKAVLPAGLKPIHSEAINTDPASADPSCPVLGQTITCETSEAIGSGRVLMGQISVEVTAPPGTLDLHASVSGGGAKEVSTTFPTQIQAAPVAFDFLPGFTAPLTNRDGSPADLAGSHPNQQTVAFSFPTENPGDGMTNAGHPRDIDLELPRGLVGNPAASPVLCTEAELTLKKCPDESQIGVVDVTTLVGAVGANGIFPTPLYNMVPPPGSPAEIATNVADAGFYAHIIAGVRSDGDYGITASTPDVIALGTQPIFGVEAQIWGDPSAEDHDEIRGDCLEVVDSCPASPAHTPLLTLPSECAPQPSRFEVHTDTWEEPAPEFEEHKALYESADLTGNPVNLEGCAEVPFEPSIVAKPTTNLTDSPSGLDFTLHQPQDADFESRSPAALKDARIAFPAGMAVNPSQAAGLDVCATEQIGFNGEEEGALRFAKAPQSCPDASKLGTLEATSPALVLRNEQHEVEEDPETGEPKLDPLKGSIYIAKPFANPFDSLIAVYLAIEDEKTGIAAKLAGKGELDPQTGQITTVFTENPELPIEDIKVHLFGGSRGALITPPTCSKYTTTSDLTPWSAPEGEDRHPESSFTPGASPLGGACPTSEAQLPNAPKLVAGTESPSAGKYSPLLFKLSREDGTQRLGKIEATLPTGLSAKLAGVGTCSPAEIAKARSREVPRQGALEQADPSCPATSEIGTVVASAGAGPSPYYTTGHAYLAGPYKGAPLSVVSIAPAVAGPFDLGAVVIQSALYLDPSTAQARIVSDPLPTVLHGVPVDLRSVSVRASRSSFSLNPTSCAVKSFGGQTLSTLGQPAPLSERFQVGGCSSLPYKPQMKVNLYGPRNRGAHPRLKAVFTAKPGEANTAKVSFTLPKSEFIDQAHFRTICTRVQFAANQCPAGSVYGQVTAYTPLLDYPLQGNAYLRSSNHKLPDLVIALRGPAYQPIAIDAVGRVDSVNGGLRVRFEEVPDAPITRLVVNTQGGKKGLFQNSTDICKGTHRATLKLDAQSGKVSDSQPKLVAQCKGKGAKGGKAKSGKGRH